MLFLGRGIDEQSSSPMLQPAKRGPPIAVPALDGRSDLLKAIRDGKLEIKIVLFLRF